MFISFSFFHWLFLQFSSCLTLPRPLSDLTWPCMDSPFSFSSPLSLLSLLSYALLWLIYAIILSSSIRVLSLFWRLVNSRLMIYQILITACWKPHSLSWCMVMIVPVWLPESQQTHSFFFFFFFFSVLPPSLHDCLSFANCFLFTLSLKLSCRISQ